MEVKLMNMCMLFNDKKQILVQERKKKYWSGIACPGGKVEPNESIVESTIREIKEETNLDITNLQFCGIKDWDEKGVKHMIFLFKTKSFSGNLDTANKEGKNFWVDIDKVKSLNLAKGFKKDLSLFLSNEIKELFYENLGNNEWKDQEYLINNNF